MKETEEKRITVICCTNNIEKYKSELLKSLETQDESYNIILIDNSNKMFSSCSEAYNSVLDRICTPYVVFAHQDITFLKPDCLRIFCDYIHLHKEPALFGAAGTNRNSVEIVSAMIQGVPPEKVGNMHSENLEECETLDECFFGCKTELIQHYRFNEKLCYGWHLYCVELCLRMKKDGIKAYVCRNDIYHSSKGIITNEYNLNFLRLAKAYRKEYPYISSTCSRCRTDVLGRNYHYIKRVIQKALKLY